MFGEIGGGTATSLGIIIIFGESAWVIIGGVEGGAPPEFANLGETGLLGFLGLAGRGGGPPLASMDFREGGEGEERVCMSGEEEGEWRGGTIGEEEALRAQSRRDWTECFLIFEGRPPAEAAARAVREPEEVAIPALTAPPSANLRTKVTGIRPTFPFVSLK